jgi:hypothetical protein
MYRADRSSYYDTYDAPYREAYMYSNNYGPDGYNEDPNTRRSYRRSINSRYGRSGYDYTDRFYRDNRTYDNMTGYSPRYNYDMDDADWRRRRFDRSAADPYQGGTQRLFGGLSLLASEYDVKRVNILLFLLGCGGVSLFLLWKKYISHWMKKLFFSNYESRLNTLLAPTRSTTIIPNVGDLDKNDPVVQEFNDFVAKKKPKMKKIIKPDLDIEDSEIDDIIDDIDEKFQNLQNKHNIDTTQVNYATNGIQYLSELENMSRQDLQELYKKECIKETRQESKINNSAKEISMMTQQKQQQQQLKRANNKKKKVRFKDQYSVTDQFVERCANIINVLRIHMQREEQ